MRLRNNPKANEILQEHQEYVVLDTKQHKGKWRDVFQNDNPIYIEIGMGKGDFILENARRYPDINFIGIEKFPSVMVGAIKKIDENGALKNLKLMKEDAVFLTEVFDTHEIDRIYLNFSDPWPKARHAKRRLTYREKLKNYRSVMSPEGTIEFKTDNDGLFAFTIDEIRNAGLSIWEMTTDLAASTFESKLFTTEYEERFGSAGKNIKYVKFK